MAGFSWNKIAAFCIAVIACGLLNACSDSDADSPNLAEEAYHQLEANVFDRGQVEDAVAKIRRAKENRPDDAWVFMALSLAVLVDGYKIGDWYDPRTFAEGSVDQAYALALKARELDPKISQTHAHLARILIIKGEFRPAWEILNEAYRLDANSFYPWYFKGIIGEKFRDSRQALQAFDEAERRVSHSYQTHLVNLHRQNVAKFEKNFEEEERLLRENIKLEPDSPHVYGNYAHFLKAHGRYDEAIEFWEKAIAIGAYPAAVKSLAETRRLKEESGSGQPE